MRIWSLHPSYLDAKGLVALWRETLLAKNVLENKTKGYKHHPQLTRFRVYKDPIAAINLYLKYVYDEACKRGYEFDATKFTITDPKVKMKVTEGQLLHEFAHLKNKLSTRDKERFATICNETKCLPHPLFKVIEGDVETWEKIYDNKNTFDYAQDFKKVDFRRHPEKYQIGKGEQGVLLVEPYKSEILPFWRFKNPEIAQESADKIYELFLNYKKQKDFVGMDMARKFLQMGYTRSRRYANHASGKKYESNPQDEITLKEEKDARKKKRPQEKDWKTNEKAQSAAIFYEIYTKAKDDPIYLKLKEEHKKKYLM